MMTAVEELRALAVQAPVPAALDQDPDQEVPVLVQVKDDRRGAKVARADPAIGRCRPVDQVASVIELRLLEVLVRIVDRVLAGQA